MFRFVRFTAVLALAALAFAPATGCKDSATLYENVGGANALTQFNDALGANLLANPAVSKFLDASAVEMVKRGIVTQVAKMSGMPQSSDGVDLGAVLKEKNMDAAGIQGFKDSAEKATKDVSLSPDAAKGVMDMINNVLKTM